MKFVALALALLLAVGSQAASLQADAPSQLAHARAAVDLTITQFKESINRALDQLDDAEYKEFKDQVIQRLEEFHTQLKAFQASVSPMTDSFFSTFVDATTELRNTLMNDIDALKTQTETQRQKLREILKNHMDQYITLLGPTLTEYYTKRAEELGALRTKMEPLMNELGAKIATNVDETKTALEPIMNALRIKIAEYIESLKVMATPYVEEYKEQVKAGVTHLRSIDPAELTALREKVEPLAEEVKTNLRSIAEAIAATITKS